MLSVAPQITNAGRSLQVRALAGEAINFTKFKVGAGSLADDADIRELDDLIQAEISVGISSIEKESNYVTINGSFSSADVTDSFVWREVGLFCEDEDGVEFLYAYANNGTKSADFSKVSDVLVTEEISLVVAVGDAENVTATLNDTSVYATKTALNDHVARTDNPHAVTKEQIGLGNVENTTVGESTPEFTVLTSYDKVEPGYKMKHLLGQIAGAIKAFIAHKSDSVSHITASERSQWNRNGAVETGTYSGTQASKRYISLGFSPSAVLVMTAEGFAGDYNNSRMYGGLATAGHAAHRAGNTSYDTIWNSSYTGIMIEGNGFYVGENGSTVHCNCSGRNYRYVAWR